MSSVFNICGGENNSFTPAPRKIVPQGTLEITENGEYDVSEFADALVAVAGGGACNAVSGTFTTGNAEGVMSVEIPYAGSGYPIACFVFPTEGAFSLQSRFDPTFAYGTIMAGVTKARPQSAPSYVPGADYATNRGSVLWGRFVADSSTTTRNLVYLVNGIYSTDGAVSNTDANIVFTAKNLMSVYVKGDGFGLIQNTQYTYIVQYLE